MVDDVGKTVAWVRTKRQSSEWDEVDFSANRQPGFDTPLFTAENALERVRAERDEADRRAGAAVGARQCADSRELAA